MPKKSIFISSFPIPLSAVALGNLVTDPKAPSQDFFDLASLSNHPEPNIAKSDILNVSSMIKSSNGQAIQASLSQFASVFLKGEQKNFQRLTSCRAADYQVKNSEDWFEDLCTAQKTKFWLERASMRGKKVYLVTGYRTLVDAFVGSESGSKLEAGAKAQVPLLASVGIPLPSGLDPSANVTVSASNDSAKGYEIPDEKIYSIQYRRVRFTSHSSKTVASAFLDSKTRWIEVCDFRGDMDEEEDDIVEVTLVDELELPESFRSSESLTEGETYLFE